MSGYIGFDKTGNAAVDKILDAIVSAGNRYHHTEFWADDDDGPSCLELIQAAANEAAASVAPAAFPDDISELVEGLGAMCSAGLKLVEAYDRDKGNTVDKPVPTLEEIVKGMIFERSGTGIGDTSEDGILARFTPDDEDDVLAALWDLVASGMVICREGSYVPGPRSGAPESRVLGQPQGER